MSLGELYEFASSNTKLHVARRWSDFQVPLEKGELSGVFEFDPSLGNRWQNSIGMNFMYIPAGEFQMGTSKNDAALRRHFDEEDIQESEDEHPQHRVRISKSFYLGQHEVTLGQFRQFVQAENYTSEPDRDGRGGTGYDAANKDYDNEDHPEFNWKNTGFKQTDEHPVVNVTWNDAVAFCDWLSEKEGRRYRLPTEAEWEYACRGGTTTLYYYGDDPQRLSSVGNVADPSLKPLLKTIDFELLRASDGFAFSAPVGRYSANPFGLYDMHGNISEWCADLYDANYYAASPTSDPRGASAGEGRVIRGGSYGDATVTCRSAFRENGDPSERSCMNGFRVLLAP